MEPHSSTGSGSRTEAERWLLIAEKLLSGRDLVGSKTFAIRARESEPRLEAADQILAVADTLIAGEKRINNQHDWYAILQLGRHAVDPELIATHYRRLAILLNPHRNRLSFADQAMKLVSDAWSVLSNPSKKSLYDNELFVFSNINPASSRGHENHEQHRHYEQEEHEEEEEPEEEDEQEQEQQQDSEEKSPTNNSKDRDVAEESENHDLNSTFWTACPYCYNMYEYPGIYEGCSLRCQNCWRAFHGTKILAPPPIIDGKETYFCCWGFFPLGISMAKLEKNKGGVSNWSPFSPMFTGPQFGDRRNVDEDNVNFAGQQNERKSSAPRIYIDDQDVYVEISESSDESDREWASTRQRKKAKNTKEKGLTGKNVKKPHGEKAKNVKGVSGSSGVDLQGGSVMQEAMRTPNMPNAETSRKSVANSVKKQAGKLPKQWGRLDLNVEFSNEVEEPAPGMSRGNGAGHGEEDGIEGIGFFEGLDEFLSSLPILKS
ncbi:hypothetical protein U1Q18_004142 [Sarracenia purpurea var. burkii]